MLSSTVQGLLLNNKCSLRFVMQIMIWFKWSAHCIVDTDISFFKSRINCSDENGKENEDRETVGTDDGDDESVVETGSMIVFNEDENGLKNMMFTGLINSVFARQDEESTPTMVVTKDELDNVLNVNIDGVDMTGDACIVVR